MTVNGLNAGDLPQHQVVMDKRDDARCAQAIIATRSDQRVRSIPAAWRIFGRGCRIVA